MRKFIPIVLSLLFYTQIQGQGAFPLINKYASWLIEYGLGPNSTPIDVPTYHTERFTQDTTIGSKKYTKYISDWDTQLIREEGEKVFILCDGGEVLLYDYSMKVGDSMYIKIHYSDEYKIQVSQIDSIEIDGQYRKKIYFSHAGALRWWIQGIGSNLGPIYTHYIIPSEINIDLATYKTPEFFFDATSCATTKNEAYCIGTKWYYSGLNDKVEIYEVVRDTFIDFRQTHIIEHKTIVNSNTTISNPNIFLSRDFHILYLWENNFFNPIFDFHLWYTNSFSFTRNNITYSVKYKDFNEGKVTFTDTNGKNHSRKIAFDPEIGIKNSFLIDENLKSFSLFGKHYGLRCFSDCNISVKSRAWESSTSSCDVYLKNDDIKEKESIFSIYPNPVSNAFSIHPKIKTGKNLEIYDITGKKMSFSIQDNQIDISNYPKGIYFLKVRSDAKIENVKILKN